MIRLARRPGEAAEDQSVVTGVSETQFELLRWYFVEVDDDTGYDAAAEVIARAAAQAAPGTPLEPAVRPAIEGRDLLADLDEVLAQERVRLADLPALLRDLAPGWGPYRTLTGVRLKELLDAEGVRVVTKANVSRLDPADLRHALAARGGGLDEG
jgi:S-DNA-T family DNA segregation ATPase FtsK/SpoIIIE